MPEKDESDALSMVRECPRCGSMVAYGTVCLCIRNEEDYEPDSSVRERFGISPERD